MYTPLAYTEVFLYIAICDVSVDLETDLGRKFMRLCGRMTMVILALTVTAGAQARFDADAVRLNNRGVALMGQQFTEKAEQSFAEAFKKDPKLAQAAINDGIALLTLQKIDDAKKALQAAIAVDPNDPQAWYNLGLAQHADNELDDALKSFQQAVKLDPRDVDSYYFEGVCYREMKQFDKAVEVLKQGLAIQPGERAFQAVPAHDKHEDFGGYRAGVWGAGTLFNGDAGGGAAGAAAGDDSGEAGGRDDRSREPNHAAKAHHKWGTGIFADRRGMHAGCDWVGADGPGVDGVWRAGDSRSTSDEHGRI